MKNSLLKIFLTLLIFSLLAGALDAKKPKKKKKNRSLVETTQLGKNKKFFSKKYQKDLNSRARKNKRKAKRRR